MIAPAAAGERIYEQARPNAAGSGSAALTPSRDLGERPEPLTPDGKTVTFNATEVISAEPCLQGFEVAVADVFSR